jgi:hypothetical protein
MSDIEMPAAVMTIDGYLLTRTAGGYTDGDLTWSHSQAVRALMTGEVTPWTDEYPPEKPDGPVRPTIASVSLNTGYFEDQYALSRFITEMDERFADNDLDLCEQTLHILAEVLVAIKTAYYTDTPEETR